MSLAFDWSSWYGYFLGVGAVLGVLLTILAFLGWLGRIAGWLIDWYRPADPDVVLGHPRTEMFTLTPHTELAVGEKRRVRTMSPAYLIENKGEVGIRDVKTGVRPFDGVHEHEFTAFHVPLLEAGRTIEVTGVGNVPEAMLRDAHESAPSDALLYWARFTYRGALRESVYDPRTRSHTSRFCDADAYSLVSDVRKPRAVSWARATRTPILGLRRRDSRTDRDALLEAARAQDRL